MQKGPRYRSVVFWLRLRYVARLRPAGSQFVRREIRRWLALILFRPIETLTRTGAVYHMSKIMDRDGYFRRAVYKRPGWRKTLDKLYKSMERFTIDVYLAGGTLPEALTHLVFDAHRAVGNARVRFLSRDGKYQKSLRRKRRKNSTRRTT